MISYNVFDGSASICRDRYFLTFRVFSSQVTNISMQSFFDLLGFQITETVVDGCKLTYIERHTSFMYRTRSRNVTDCLYQTAADSVGSCKPDIRRGRDVMGITW
mmetsp:Transcript_29637/g.71684  ORF Transcript_29637/g.71684 Transcript_29637/m.71684 type:complete len:104 (-) Transcript_29637:2742-3053(-)